MNDAVVLGAGISGLAAARRLAREGYRVTVLEAGDRPGGTLRTFVGEGFRVEFGPNTVPTTPELQELCADAGCAADLVPASSLARRRYVLQRGRLVALPGTPPQLLTSPLLSWVGKLRLLAEPFQRPGPGAEESVLEFFRRRLGAEAATLFADLAVTGVYAGKPDELAIGGAFPRLLAFEAEHGSLLRGLRAAGGTRPQLVSFRGGFERLAACLAGGLAVRYRTMARSLRRRDTAFEIVAEGPEGRLELVAGRVVTALSASATAALFAEEGTVRLLHGALGHGGLTLPHAPVVVAGFTARRDHVGHPLDGFGFLVPRSEPSNLLGGLFASTLFPETAPAGEILVTVLAGGRRRPDLVDLDVMELLTRLSAELTRLLDVRGPLRPLAVHVWRPGIPQPTPALFAARQQAADLEAAPPGLTILGGWRHGVGVPDCVRAGWGLVG